jgi:two-component system cell cycle sensor histidine kinase/response regulator CckA
MRARNRVFISWTFFLLAPASLAALPPQVVRIGIVTDQSHLADDFRAFTDYLDAALSADFPGVRFQMVAATTTERLVEMVGRNEVDFTLSNPISVVQLSYREGARPIATALQVVQGEPSPSMAGVAFTLESKSNIRTIVDARHRRIAALDPFALGGWLAFAGEWRRLGIDPDRAAPNVSFLNNYWKIASAVCSGKADVGVLSTAAFERIRSACPAGFRILTTPGLASANGQASTRRYPESAVMAREGLDEQLVSHLAAALITMPRNGASANAAHVYAFTAPLSYVPVEHLMQELRTPPFQDYGRLTTFEAVRQHWLQFIAALCFFLLLLSGALVRTRRLYQELHRSESFRKRLFDSSPLPILVAGGADGRLIEANAQAVRALGRENRNELIGASFFDVSAPEQADGEPAAERARRYLDAAKSPAEAVFEWRFQRPDKTTRDAELHAIEFESDNGRLIQFTAIDVTESRRLAQRVHLLAHALESAGEAIWICGTSGEIMYVNEAFRRTYGFNEGEIIGKNMSALISARTDTAVRERLLGDPLTDSWRGDIWNIAKDGREFPVMISFSAIKDDNQNRLATIVCARDMTDFRQLQEQYLQSQKLEAIGQLAGGVAHDFNNLLTVINGYSEMLLNAEGATPLEGVREIHEAGVQAAELTRQLLAFSRRQVIRLAPVDINGLIRDSGKMFQRLLGEDITLQMDLDPDVGRALADHGSVHQVLMNLLVNARQAMPRGGAVTISTRHEALHPDGAARGFDVEPGDYVALAVADNGAGMSEEVRSRIFEPFFSTKGEQGSGLGLATVYGIVQQSKGAIAVASSPGHGALFTVYLPRTTVPEQQPETRARPADLRSSGAYTVMVLEDQDDVRSYTRRVLERAGYKVIEASRGEEAIAIALRSKEPVHLLVSDVILGSMNGLEVWNQFRQLRPESRLLFVSGYSDKVISERGVLTDGFTLLQKPYTPDALLEHVQAILRQEATITAEYSRPLDK